MYASTQYTLPPTIRVGSDRGIRDGWGENYKQVEVPGNFNRCGKAGHYVRDFPKWNTYWDSHPSGTEDTSTKVHLKKGDKPDVTLSYCSVC